VRVGQEPAGDYLALAQGLQSDRNRAVIEDALARFNFIGQYLVNDTDRDAYREWLRQYLTPMMRDVGYEQKAGDSDEDKTLRADLLNALGYTAGDPEALRKARQIADQSMADPASVDHQLAAAALALVAVNGDSDFYEKLMAALKNPKSPEEYYLYFATLAQFTDRKLLERTLEFAISPEVRSQDALQLVTATLANPAGQRLAWDFVRQRWNDIEKAGGPFANGQVVAATGTFCEADLRDQVTEFFVAHKVEGAERTYKQSLESINDCIELKSQQGSQLASWLGQHGTATGK